MGENPLQNCKFTKTKSLNKYMVNARGRPKSEKMILFSEQPQSIVSQMLCKLKSDKQSMDENPVIEELLVQEALKKCETNELFKSEESQERKYSKSNKSYSCNFSGCKYTCKLSSNLIKHKRVHTDEKPYLCDKCTFRTNFVNSLKVHKRIHTSERPYHCQYCNYKCNSSSNLKKHCLHRHLDVIRSTMNITLEN